MCKYVNSHAPSKLPLSEGDIYDCTSITNLILFNATANSMKGIEPSPSTHSVLWQWAFKSQTVSRSPRRSQRPSINKLIEADGACHTKTARFLRILDRQFLHRKSTGRWTEQREISAVCLKVSSSRQFDRSFIIIYEYISLLKVSCLFRLVANYDDINIFVGKYVIYSVEVSSYIRLIFKFLCSIWVINSSIRKDWFEALSHMITKETSRSRLYT